MLISSGFMPLTRNHSKFWIKEATVRRIVLEASASPGQILLPALNGKVFTFVTQLRFQKSFRFEDQRVIPDIGITSDCPDVNQYFTTFCITSSFLRSSATNHSVV